MWERKSLGQLCSIKGRIGYRGYTKQDLVKEGDGAISLSPSNIINDQLVFDKCTYLSWNKYEESPEIMVYEGDIIYCKTASIGKMALVKNLPEKATLNPQFVVLKEISCSNKYLYYYMTSKEFREKAKGITGGTAVPTLSQANLASLTVPLASPEEQKQIVAILDAAFTRIDQAIAYTEQNIQNARELFESYLNTIFTQKGEGWEEKYLKDLCEITATLVDPTEKEFLDLPHIGAGNMISQSDELIDVQTAREERLISGKFIFEDGVVLYSKIRPYLMKVSRPNFTGLCSADVYPLMPIKNVLDRDFLFYMLLSKDFTDYAVKGSARAGMPKVNRPHLFAYKTHIPSLKEQKVLAQKIDEIHKLSKTSESIYRQKLVALKELKQSLLQKAFAGELTSSLSEVA